MNTVDAAVRPATDPVLRQEVEDLLRTRDVSMVFHPVMRLGGGQMLGTEALARMGTDPSRSPADWFAQAAQVGLQTDLEVLAVRRALVSLPELPKEAFLFINVTPLALVTPEFQAIFEDIVAERIVLDVSVNASIASYSKLLKSLQNLRSTGMRISIDDAGDDRMSWLRINRLEPEIIKLGPAITRGLIGDAKAREVARHFLAFAADIHADVIAEAIESEEERDMLLDLGVTFGQGYLYGRPGPLESLSVALSASKR